MKATAARLVAGYDFEGPAADASLDVKLKTLLGQLELGVKHSPDTRADVGDRVRAQMPELLRHLNWVVEQAAAARTSTARSARRADVSRAGGRGGRPVAPLVAGTPGQHRRPVAAEW